MVFPAKDRNALGYASLALHTLTLVWHIVWFAISVSVSLWVEIQPSSWTALLDRIVSSFNIPITIVWCSALVVSTGAIILRRPSFAKSWVKQLLFVFYLAATFCLALYDGDMFDVYNPAEVGIGRRMCLITMDSYSTLNAFPLSIVVSVLWLLLVSEVGETKGIQLPEDEREGEE
ncbi:hypothetical protein FIBSPDRAFT_862445 [Athelia psychrophila]|uniref:Uncharacterized protein n=1 Tax=Athelia psychrophila TaxID=1759441 RepID=A0A166IF44_9AGAM|nr:hypothetical protein FIBSPDRAFT_862445 [Fibularhizoctonia sp. CBS 109695]